MIGAWVKGPVGVAGDDVCRRIRWLISKVLAVVGIEKDSGGWRTLYRDPADGRYWLLSYPQGELQGGGPEALKNVSPTDAELKNRYISPEKWEARVAEDRRRRNIRIISPIPPEE